MSNDEQTRGKLKEYGGKITGDDKLEQEGREERKKGEAKEKFRDAKDTVKGGIAAAKDSITGEDDDRA